MQNAFDGLHSNLWHDSRKNLWACDLSTEISKTNGKKKCGVRIYKYYREPQKWVICIMGLPWEERERESEKRWEGGKKAVIIFEVIRAENQR